MLTNQTVSVANRCNLACTYCWYETDSLSYTGQEVDTEEYARWFDRCAEAAALESIVLTGGEPTLDPRLIEIIDLASAAFPRVALLTNGVTLSDREDILETISRRGVEVHISLDHVTDGLGDKVRGGTKAALLSIGRLTDAGVTVQVTMVLTSRNASDLDAVATYCRDVGAALEVAIVAVPDHHPLSVRAMPPAQRVRAARSIQTAADLLGRPGYYAQVRAYLLGGRITPLRQCHTAATGAFIDTDGTVSVCGHRREVLGSILLDSPTDILARQRSVLAAEPAGPCVTLNCLALT